MVIFYSILLNLAFLLIGYLLFGSFNTSIILSNKYKKDDIRKHYSHNAGATNSLRTYGKKFALIVFLIDIFKTFVPTIILAALLNHIGSFNSFSQTYYISPQSLALGVVIGHIFPLYFKFHGGKGVACTIGLIATMNIIIFIIAAILFFTILFSSRMVSLGSILTAFILIPICFIPWLIQGSLGYWSNFVNMSNSMSNLQNYWYVSPIIYSIAAIFIICAHHSNIRRIIKKEEHKF
ncbi:glycerol-3-phosphate 1-O-acyltransferase PlsY [Mycoplasmopsis lipofaciens]|uniref:glycerol-3-phosphate 1-O-acyltransferase PlsY n=1 Tax=Mycoplasmopsis lipofaciens TaxID=114884 RepID=UPI000482E4CF|nr:glycerol-3-phosphate 1-O-acyltransferase PlsY [Mycoplasmopsis lipofaciens]